MRKNIIFTVVLVLILILGIGCSIDQAGSDKVENDGISVENIDEMQKASFEYVIDNEASYCNGVVSDHQNYLLDFTASNDYSLYVLKSSSNNQRYITEFDTYEYWTVKEVSTEEVMNVDKISWVSSKWQIIGADNSRKKIIFNALKKTSNHYTIYPYKEISYPSDVYSITDIEGKDIGNGRVELYITFRYGRYGTGIKKGVYYRNSGYTYWSPKKSFNGMYDRGLMIVNNYLYSLHKYSSIKFRRRYGVNGSVQMEKLTSPYTAHGYEKSPLGNFVFNPKYFDYTENDGGNIYGLVKNGTKYDIVRIRLNDVKF